MTLALLAHEDSQATLLEDNQLCRLIFDYTSRIANPKMAALVANPELRLPISKVNTEALGKFDARPVAGQQRRSAPLITSLLRVCTGLKSVDSDSAFDSDDSDEGLKLGDKAPAENKHPKGRNRILIASYYLPMRAMLYSKRAL